MEITIIGLGLIGCSLARDLRRKLPGVVITGVDKNRAHSRTALRLGYIDRISDRAAASSNVVILALPVNVIEKILPQVLSTIEPRTLVMDVGSTKERICKAVAGHPNRKNFLACHPMAGTENAGPEAAIEGLFHKKVMVVCEKHRSSLATRRSGLALIKKLGMRVVFMDPERHDLHAAYVSHVSHVISYVLAITVLQKEKSSRAIFDLGGSGFQSTVRLAKSHPEMWTPIFLENADRINDVLEEYIRNLEKFRNAILLRDGKRITRQIKKANRIRSVLR